MSDLTAMKASGGFFIHTHADTVGGNPVKVNLRGGSSSSITTERLVMLMTRDDRMLGDIEPNSTTAGGPTIGITNPQHPGSVPRVVNCVGRIEFKFATTWDYVQAVVPSRPEIQRHRAFLPDHVVADHVIGHVFCGFRCIQQNRAIPDRRSVSHDRRTGRRDARDLEQTSVRRTYKHVIHNRGFHHVVGAVPALVCR